MTSPIIISPLTWRGKSESIIISFISRLSGLRPSASSIHLHTHSFVMIHEERTPSIANLLIGNISPPTSTKTSSSGVLPQTRWKVWLGKRSKRIIPSFHCSPSSPSGWPWQPVMLFVVWRFRPMWKSIDAHSTIPGTSPSMAMDHSIMLNTWRSTITVNWRRVTMNQLWKNENIAKFQSIVDLLCWKVTISFCPCSRLSFDISIKQLPSFPLVSDGLSNSTCRTSSTGVSLYRSVPIEDLLLLLLMLFLVQVMSVNTNGSIKSVKALSGKSNEWTNVVVGLICVSARCSKHVVRRPTRTWPWNSFWWIKRKKGFQSQLYVKSRSFKSCAIRISFDWSKCVDQQVRDEREREWDIDGLLTIFDSPSGSIFEKQILFHLRILWSRSRRDLTKSQCPVHTRSHQISHATTTRW